MYSNCLRAALAALIVSLGLGQAAWAQSQSPANAASGQIQFPQIPLRRDVAGGGSIAESAGWAALFLVVVAGASFLVVRRKTMHRLRLGGKWLRPSAGDSTPKPLGRMPLTHQATLHVIEWQGEELLLGCTSQSVALLARRPTDPLRANGVDGAGMKAKT